MFLHSAKLRQKLSVFSAAVLVLSTLFGNIVPLVAQAQSAGLTPTDLRISSQAKSNFTGGFNATPVSLVNGNWTYNFQWGRTLSNRNGYIYVSQLSSTDNLYHIVAEFPANVDTTNSAAGLPGVGSVTSSAVFAPNTQYRLSYYSFPYGQYTSNYLILRSPFTTPDSSAASENTSGSESSDSASGNNNNSAISSNTSNGNSGRNVPNCPSGSVLGSDGVTCVLITGTSGVIGCPTGTTLSSTGACSPNDASVESATSTLAPNFNYGTTNAVFYTSKPISGNDVYTQTDGIGSNQLPLVCSADTHPSADGTSCLPGNANYSQAVQQTLVPNNPMTCPSGYVPDYTTNACNFPGTTHCGIDNGMSIATGAYSGSATDLLDLAHMCSDASRPSVIQVGSTVQWYCGVHMCSAPINGSTVAATPIVVNGVTFYPQPNSVGRFPNSLDSFINDVYETLYGRPADASGEQFWINYLTSSSASFGTFYQDMFSQAEYTNEHKSDLQFVTDAFRVILYRAPDPGGQSFWISALNTGTSRSSLITNLVSSAEFTTSGAGGNQAIQKVLQSDILAYAPGTNSLSCGSANGQTFSAAASLNANNMCSDGSTPTISVNGTGGWSWSCAANVVCNAYAPASSQNSLATCQGLDKTKLALGFFNGLTCTQALQLQIGQYLTSSEPIPLGTILSGNGLIVNGSGSNAAVFGAGPEGPVGTPIQLCIENGSYFINPAVSGASSPACEGIAANLGSGGGFKGGIIYFDGQAISGASCQNGTAVSGSNPELCSFVIPPTLPDGTKVLLGVHHIQTGQIDENGNSVNIGPPYAITVTPELPECGGLPFGVFSGVVIGWKPSTACAVGLLTGLVATSRIPQAPVTIFPKASLGAQILVGVRCNQNSNQCGGFTAKIDGQVVATNLNSWSGKYGDSNFADLLINIPDGTSYGSHDLTLVDAFGDTLNTLSILVTGTTYAPNLPVPINDYSKQNSLASSLSASNSALYPGTINIGCSATQSPTITSINGVAGTMATITPGSTMTIKGNCFSRYNNTVAFQMQKPGATLCFDYNPNDGGADVFPCKENFGIGPLPSPDGQTITFQVPKGMLASELGEILLGNNFSPINVLALFAEQGVSLPFVGGVIIN
ncbi:MAG: DUF4214 domain-containing protein [Candidatus Doudnabacteria bacterium]|nr:DUF4214 domain-containing protein [Candidatus Doudnabacteria bacterium]